MEYRQYAARQNAFDALVKEEQLDADKLQQVIDRYMYTGQKPLLDPNIVELITRFLRIADPPRKTRERVHERVMEYVQTFDLVEAACR